MHIRAAERQDAAEWGRMRLNLWPEAAAEHPVAIAQYFAGQALGLVMAFVLEREPAHLGGFIELNLRDYAEGSLTTPVPYVEGWYVDADLRQQGYGAQLMQAAEQWAIAQGYHELASDTGWDNGASMAAHQALGFAEVDRLVCFLKRLPS